MLPLDDLTVLDLSRILSGPYCSMYLGDFGARVIKLEHPVGGDDTRGFGPSVTGPADGPSFKVGTSIRDMVAGLYALSGILVALQARARTGRGQHVDVSMLDGQISLLTYHAGIHFATGAVPARRGNQHPSIS